MTDPKTASVKGGVQPPQPKTRRILFSILMVGALLSLLALFKIARPFVENHSYLDIALIAGIIFIVLAYILAVKGGIPPAPPKTTDNLVESGGPSSPKTTIKSGKRGISDKGPQAAIKGGIDPPTRKTNG